MANEFIIKKGFVSKANSQVTGSLNVSGSLNVNGSPVGSAFPFEGDAVITGSLTISGSFSSFRIDSRDVILGEGAGNNATVNGPRNVMIGQNAGYTNTTGDDNVCVGWNAGYALSTNASDRNIFIGKLSGAGGTTPAARMSSATDNIGIGIQTLLYLNTGDNNVAIGANAMRGSGATMSGKYNIALGTQALYSISSGDSNIGIGYRAGRDQTTGDGNITIGSGSLGVAGESNQLRIGHADLAVISASLATGDIIFPSSASFTGLPTTEPNITGSLWISGSSPNHPNSGYLMIFNP